MPDEAKKGLKAKELWDAERRAITSTIGEIFNHKMRGAPVDAAAFYRRVGGESDFTYRLFAETFGSKSAKTKGLISSNPSDDTPLDEINAALAKTAQKLSRAKVKNLTGEVTTVERFNPIGPIAGDYICLKIGAVAGGQIPLPGDGDPFVYGPTAWLLGAQVSHAGAEVG